MANDAHQTRKQVLPLRIRDLIRKPLRRTGRLWAPHTIYQELDSSKQEFRVLEIEPGNGDDPIYCTLHRVSLSGLFKPRYETISYVWGDKTVRGTIYLHDIATDVPASSEIVLRRMRFPTKKRVLWLDSVCINQQDLKERSQQVAFMDKIYASGMRNLVWLGEDDGTTVQALGDIGRIAEDMRKETNDFQDAKEVLFDESGSNLFSTTQLKGSINHIFALKRLYSKSWFSRLWIVQEVALSRMNSCYCGSLEFDLRDVLRAAVWLNYKWSYLSAQDFQPHVLRAAYIADFADEQCGRYNLFPTTSWAAYHFISDLRVFHSEDPRDHIYAVLGLLQRYNDIQEIPHALMPDYEASLSEVWCKAIKYCITVAGQLDSLNSVSHRPQDVGNERLTWIPRWDRVYDLRNDPELFDTLNFQADYGISLDSSLLELQDTSILALRGLVVGSVAEVTSTLHVYSRGHTSPDEEIKQLLDPIRRFAPRNKDSASDNDVGRMIGSTLIAGTDFHRASVNDDECARLYEAYEHYIATRGLPPDTGELNDLSDGIDTQAVYYRVAIARACHNRCFFSTTAGGFGLAPQTTKSGDIVVILYGSDVPYILRASSRSNNATHELVGECYVYGIMHGEAVVRHQSQGKEDEIFYLA